jgi:predicted amidohydrolase YtcJ
MPAIELVAPPGEDKARPVEEFSLGDQPEWLRIGATKIFSDGALTTRTAAVSVPFDGEPENLGLFMWQPDELRDMIRRAHDAGWQIATHAIGDRAVQLVLDCYEAALQAAPREDHRHRIEHCMMLEPQQALRMQQLGVIAVLQPGFIGRLGDAYITVLGAERAAQLNPMERFDMLGIPVAFSSDRPVIPGAPLKGIRSAMQRLSPQGVVLGREHAITALQAIRYYTSGAAFASRTDDFSGTLVRDKVADFTVLSRNPAETAAEDFGRVRVERTVVGGIETFE